MCLDVRGAELQRHSLDHEVHCGTQPHTTVEPIVLLWKGGEWRWAQVPVSGKRASMHGIMLQLQTVEDVLEAAGAI